MTMGYTQTGHTVCARFTALAAGQQININAVEAGVTYMGKKRSYSSQSDLQKETSYPCVTALMGTILAP